MMDGPLKKKRRSKWDQPDHVTPHVEGEEAVEASVSAAEAAARINAMLAAKGKLLHSTTSTSTISSSMSDGGTPAEIEINDCDARSTLTKGPTLNEINKTTGTLVTVRGRYMTPLEKANKSPSDKPLHLYIQGPNQAFINAAVVKIREMIASSGEVVGVSEGGVAQGVSPLIIIIPMTSFITHSL
jgi:hypothetical protein